MILDTKMTLALLQELLMALRANDADSYKSWLALGIEQLGREVSGKGFMTPIPITGITDGWHVMASANGTQVFCNWHQA
jgi:hypothetical protein